MRLGPFLTLIKICIVNFVYIVNFSIFSVLIVTFPK